MAYKCSKCNEEITKKEYEYSMKKFNSALCRTHQKNNNSSQDSKGLSKRESNYKEGMIKGRIAETLIEELFLSLDYNVFRYGMENTVPGIMELLKGVRSDVATNIRRMPDYVVQHRKTKEVFFIEIKFRTSEEFKKSDLPKDYPYENCYFIIVSKKHIKCITYAELMEGKEVTPKSKNYLGSRKEFDLDKNVIIDFCDFAVKFFKEV
jgi:hypothetical protein